MGFRTGEKVIAAAACKERQLENWERQLERADMISRISSQRSKAGDQSSTSLVSSAKTSPGMALDWSGDERET